MEEIYDKFNFPISFQVSVLSYLFHDANLFRKFTKYVKLEYFTEFQFRNILELAIKFFEKYEEVPQKTSLLNELNSYCIKTNGRTTIQDYQSYVNTIYEFNFNESYIKDEIIRFVQVQAVYTALKECTKFMHMENKVVDTVVEAASIKNKLLFDGGYDYKKEVTERTKLLKKGVRKSNQIPIGVDAIDKITKGGLGSGELGVVIGQPGIGKSIFLCNIGIESCMRGKKVFYATLESSAETLSGRIDGSVSTYTEEEMKLKTDKLITSVMRLKGELKLKEFPQAATTASDIANYINDLIANGFKPDIIILDYIGIMAPERKFKEVRHAIQNICQTIVAKIAKRFEVPVWSAHQSSEVAQDSNIGKLGQSPKNDSINKVIGISGIAEAKVALAAECDFLISLNQNAIEKSQIPEGMRVHVIKNRIGPDKGTYHINIDKKRFIITEAGKLDMPRGV
jgi:replicative DNA helicase